MKAVIAYDLGEDFVADLRSSFPEVDFVTAFSEAEQLAQAVEPKSSSASSVARRFSPRRN